MLGRRADGYHELDTLAVFADIGDRLTATAADEISLSVAGPLAAHAPADPENLVLKASRLLARHAQSEPGAAITLEKHLPAGAGFGGGSADAAAVLLALNELWSLRLGQDGLGALAQKLGSDVPMCLEGGALRARGRGERTEPIEGWPRLPMVLVWPGRGLATVAVFAALTRRDNDPLGHPPDARTPEDVARWLTACRNDLEAPATGLAPEIGDALAALRGSMGCLIARMSGSGSGCFGIYPAGKQAAAAAEAIQNARPGWWVRACEAS